MTKIYGTSDDLIEFEGDVYGEVGCYGTDQLDRGVLVICSDGTLLEVQYGKLDSDIWEVKLVQKGILFREIELCNDPNAEPYSDVAYFNDGLTSAFAATKWGRVK